jgi:hypothetical protein
MDLMGGTHIELFAYENRGAQYAEQVLASAADSIRGMIKRYCRHDYDQYVHDE